MLKNRRISIPYQFLSMALLCLLLISSAAPVYSQGSSRNDVVFPPEGYTVINSTVPNDQLDFNDDKNESCCTKDQQGNPANKNNMFQGQNSGAPDPYPVSSADPSYLNECSQFAELSELVSNESDFPDLSSIQPATNRTIYSESTNASIRQNAGFFIKPSDTAKPYQTENFHIASQGGHSVVNIRNVSSYSVCMARGGNVAAVYNTDNGSILTYNGNDHVYLAGNNTNMLTRTGAGQDIIEIHQAAPIQTNSQTGDEFRGESWAAYNIYRTALSGGAGNDTVVIKNTPSGTKWCHLGGYMLFGEYFYVIEFALPPSVTEGPRRQRINIGRSVESVVFRGRRYDLSEFLHHGIPADEVARSVPVGGSLKEIPVNYRR